MNMEIQYSLLAALIDEKKANLFDDIVLHIIEYVVSLIAEDSSFSAKYHSTSSLQDKITEIVGIKIPITIIRNAVSLVSKKSDDIAIRAVGDKGNLFTIQRAWDTNRYDGEGNLIHKSPRNILQPPLDRVPENWLDRLFMRRKLSKKEIEKHYSWQEGDTRYNL